MNKSEQINELAAALSAFQGDVANPVFSREVTVAGQKGSYKFKYAELNEILNLVRPILAKHGLSIVQSSTGDGDSVTVTTTLLHKSGQFLESSIPCARPDKMQELGSAITYLRRYSITGILGIAGEEDDDANSTDGNSITDSKKPTAKKWGSGPPLPKTPPPLPPAQAKVVEFVPAQTWDDFHDRAMSAATRIAKTPGGAEFLSDVGERHGFSLKPDAPNNYRNFELRVLNEALCEMEARL